MIKIRFKFIENIYSKLKKIRINIIFKLPSADVIIWEEVRENIIREYLPSSKKIFVVKYRELCIYLEPTLLLNILRNLLKKELILIILIDGLKKGFLRYFKDSLDEAIINQIKPKLVITFIDNNPRFGRLSSKFEGIRFIAIQNGCRSRWDTQEVCKHDIYLSFLKQEANSLNKLGWEIKEANNIGSINAAKVFASLKSQNFKKDLLIISSWRGNIKIDFDYLEQYKAMTQMHIFLNSIIQKENYNAGIIMRSRREGKHWFIKDFNLNEEQYYRNIYGDRCEIIDNKTLEKEIYEEINKSHLSVSFLTTAILEGHIYGHNCLYLNFYKNDYYHQDLPKELILSNENKYLLESEIKKKINKAKKRSEDIFLISKTKSEHTINKFRKILNTHIN